MVLSYIKLQEYCEHSLIYWFSNTYSTIQYECMFKHLKTSNSSLAFDIDFCTFYDGLHQVKLGRLERYHLHWIFISSLITFMQNCTMTFNIIPTGIRQGYHMESHKPRTKFEHFMHKISIRVQMHIFIGSLQFTLQTLKKYPTWENTFVQ